MVLIPDVGGHLGWWPLYGTGTEIRLGDQPPWGSEVPLLYLTTEGSSSGGAGSLESKLHTRVQLPTVHEARARG